MKFSNFDIIEFITDISDSETERLAREAAERAIIEHLGKLEMIEEFAEYHDLISSELELSERFDEEQEGWLTENAEDRDAINQAFNNWSDMLCKNGEIDNIQYHHYGYIGEYSK